MQLSPIRRAVACLVCLAALTACGGDATYRFRDVVTACETLDWARGRQERLESGDTAEANRYGATRCFRVEPTQRVVIEDSEGGLLLGSGWAEVVTVDGSALEHLASAELRKAMGQPVRTRGWVSRDVLEEIGG
jgi:hypothetical protein